MKDLIIRTLKHEEVERVPWVPFSGVHAGYLKGYTATEFLTDPDKAFESLMEVNRLYRPDGQPVIFDLQIEAECLGCDLKWVDDCPPSVISHPLETEDEDEPPATPCDCKIPSKDSGRIPYVLEVMRRMKEAVGDTTALYGLICGPFTLASHLRGNEIFTDMYDFEDEVQSLFDWCARCCMQMADYYIEAGMDVIALVDPLISQISTGDFEDYMSEPYTKIFDHIREKGAFSSFFVCGDASRNIESMLKTGPDSISIDENVDIVKAKELCDQYNIAIGGNIPLTTVMLNGNQQDNMKACIDIIDSVPNNNKNFILAPGCDMPYNVPVENAIGCSQAAIETDKIRDVIKDYKPSEIDTSMVELPDYEHLEKPLIEVCTIDSAQCAACGYMVGAANVAKEKYGDKIDVVEYKWIEKENIARFVKMGVTNLPAMYINGELKWKSIIPSSEELDKAIDETLEKMGK